MQLKDLENKRKSLNNISLKVNNEKNIYLINIMKLNQRLSFFNKNALVSRQIILHLKEIYNIKNDMLRRESRHRFNLFRKINRNILWIYLTEEQKYSTDSYSRYEKTILSNIKKSNNEFILIGKNAIKFGQDNNLQVLQSYENSNIENLAEKLTKIVMILYEYENYEEVNFVVNSNKNFNQYFTILPMSKFSFEKFPLNESNNNLYDIDFKRAKIYPNINDFINSQINCYLLNTINMLISESAFYKAKIGLVSTNTILKDLDESVLKLKKQISRAKSELQIEELNLLTKKDPDEGDIYE
ncbi:MSC_0622 family F1-like ATPase gamma subunit [Metamycoplasma hominis]|uniref:MSC_0622 family F1-like ATPase gamma subunit n=1 Tax=Metamycoplasma hominis TaxID=2098 RepID=UPI0005135193|nr:hypothetical protein [Metamycoplasma hominis]KGF61053.1 hypothetical protein JX73_02625 [Metamycoplasma hominis]QKX36706.1 hypothetical protein HU153_01865 [Metamycoplasma hominis]